MKHLYSAVYDGIYPFHSLVPSQKAITVNSPVEMLSFDSALIVWGGSDIAPELYKHPLSSRCAPYAARRDRVEWALMQEAIDMEIPIIGVCRGAQMLCAAAGGYLIQDMNNHAGRDHKVTTREGKEFYVNSIHHQMMVPYDVEHELLAWSTEAIGAPYIYKDDKIFNPGKGWKEAEFVYFPKIKGYAIQWHPEAMDDECVATQYILDFIRSTEAARQKKKEALPHAANDPA